MKTIIIALLIPFVIVADVALTICTLGYYAVSKVSDCNPFITETLIRKL